MRGLVCLRGKRPAFGRYFSPCGADGYGREPGMGGQRCGPQAGMRAPGGRRGEARFSAQEKRKALKRECSRIRLDRPPADLSAEAEAAKRRALFAGRFAFAARAGQKRPPHEACAADTGKVRSFSGGRAAPWPALRGPSFLPRAFRAYAARGADPRAGVRADFCAWLPVLPTWC